jgi:outer membrane receptor protein involved in Fe transport
MLSTPAILMRPQSYLVAGAAILAVGLARLAAQTAPTNSGPASPDNTIKLDPFNVSAQSDVGFVAANSLAGGRMTTALKDTPVAYSVLTSEFLEAFNITDAGKAAEFSVNTNYNYNDGLQAFNGNTTVIVRIRGQNANTPTQNFFPYNIAADSYNVDRIDFARGANASLFGAGGSAGTQNTVTKQALTTKTVREVKSQYGSWDRFRFTVDVNQPINKKLAVRASALFATGNTWRTGEWEDRRGLSLAATYHLHPKLTLRAAAEYRVTDKSTGTNHTRDNISAWDGKFTPSGIDLAMSAAQMALAGVTRSTRRFVTDVDNPTFVYNIINRFQTKGGQYNATATNWLGGQPIRTIGFSLNNTDMTRVWDMPIRFASTNAATSNLFLADKSFTPLWQKERKYPVGFERGKDASLYLTYRPFDNFYAELSGDVNRVVRWSEYQASGGGYNMFMDINRLKPDGSPNPYFLRQYSENMNFTFDRSPSYQSVNLQLAYVKDSRWGKLQFGVMAGIQNQQVENRQSFFILPLQNGVLPGSDFRAFFGQADQNIQSVYTRQYFNLPNRPAYRHPHLGQSYTAIDPTVGTKAVLTPRYYFQPNRPGFTDDLSKTYKFVQIPLNLNLFKNRLVLVGAVRRDLTKLADVQYKLSDDMPVGWDGTYLTPKPRAPADYYGLMYTPKNATGKALLPTTAASARPRTVNAAGVAVPLAQYANDRFQDDTTTPDVTSAVNTRTFGAVVNITQWLGVYANDSTTFDLNAGNLNVYAQLIPPTASKSLDYGIRLTLPNGRLNASIGMYSAYQEGATLILGGGLKGNIDTFAGAPVVGDLSDGGGNIRGMGVLPGRDIYTTLTSETKGIEAEVTANLTRNWRLVVNAGKNRPTQKDYAPEIPGYIDAKDTLIRQILGDSGILINAQNQAFINPALNNPATINVTRVEAVANAWNSYQTTTIPLIMKTASTPSRQAGGPEISANIATDYRFTSGWFKGLRAGIAMNYRGRQILGARTADTIVNPANPALSIPDPAGGATSYVWGGGYTKATGNLSYTYRLKEGSRRYAPKTIQFDLAIDNLLGMNRPIAEVIQFSVTGNVFLAPLNNDISQPAVRSTPGTYNYHTPRNYMLTAKLNF